MKVLAISDSHVPARAAWIPRPIEEFILKGKFDIVVHAGDVTTAELVNSIKENTGAYVYVVRGNMDTARFPRYVKVTVEGVPLGAVHGDGIYPRGNIAVLTRIATKMGVKLLVSGHTHTPFIVYDKAGVLHVNPGSVTGVVGGGGGNGVPSLVVLQIESKNVAVELHELVGKDLTRRNQTTFYMP
jgi:putative phosphoesterase